MLIDAMYFHGQGVHREFVREFVRIMLRQRNI
jgi:hypothetical protein